LLKLGQNAVGDAVVGVLLGGPFGHVRLLPVRAAGPAGMTPADPARGGERGGEVWCRGWCGRSAASHGRQSRALRGERGRASFFLVMEWSPARLGPSAKMRQGWQPAWAETANAGSVAPAIQPDPGLAGVTPRTHRNAP
jgi:hypothetical protein